MFQAISLCLILMSVCASVPALSHPERETYPVDSWHSSVQSRQRLALPPERPMNGERPERNRDRTGTGTTGTERRSVPFLAFLAFPVVPVHSSEKMERCLLKLSCYQTKRNLTFKTI